MNDFSLKINDLLKCKPFNKRAHFSIRNRISVLYRQFIEKTHCSYQLFMKNAG